METEEKWKAVKAHYEYAYKIKFSEKPSDVVVNHLYSEYAKFLKYWSSYCKLNPEAEDRTKKTVGLKIMSKYRDFSELDDREHSNELPDDSPTAA